MKKSKCSEKAKTKAGQARVGVEPFVSNPVIAFGWKLRGPGCRNCVAWQQPSGSCGFDKSFQFQTFKDSWCEKYKEKELW